MPRGKGLGYSSGFWGGPWNLAVCFDGYFPELTLDIHLCEHQGRNRVGCQPHMQRLRERLSGGLRGKGVCFQASGLEFNPGDSLDETRTNSRKLSSDLHTNTYIQTNTHIHTHIFWPAHTHMHIHTNAHIHSHAHICIHIHTHMHNKCKKNI